ncbi:hypothetical protein [Noviluteimonas gilva]|uniref:Uncharacterized protein n=1 Tax=Noviluteimonas gilva TaxID=2682097 RepID=A0A7C9HLH1_9GAMM|nr:hypothetical protein [Lysobacter gilvus]MUV13536.1 hypothetical protein [Lysobacter gilvus]
MSAHSQGPWTLRDSEIPEWQNPLQIEDVHGLCVVSLERGRLHDAESNARLIAAAPEMLDALVAVVEGGADSVGGIDLHTLIAKATQP